MWMSQTVYAILCYIYLKGYVVVDPKANEMDRFLTIGHS